MPDVLLKIVVNEQQHEKRNATCKKILTYLWEQGAPGATMRRGEAGLDYRGILNYDLLEDSYFNDLPIMIEISSVEGINENNLKNHSHFIVKVYTRESSKLIKKDEYEKILLLLQKHKAIWATVTKAIAGYGSDRVIYGQHLFSPSEHLPLIIECVVEREHLSLLLDELKSVVTEGAVFTAPVDLIINK